MKIVCVIDMQNDFIDMALGTKEAQAIVAPMADFLGKLERENTVVFATRDTHHEDYIDTNEGRHLPVPHCIEGTKGWEINADIAAAIEGATVVNKPNFGIAADTWKEYLKDIDVTEIELMGLCTDICVISNALALKTAFPEIPVRVHAALCAGVTPDTHDAAIRTMGMCQVDII